MDKARLLDKAAVERFLLAGNAYFTIVNPSNGHRYTFRVSQAESRDGKPAPYFVGVLTGPDNERSYSFLGTLWPNGKYFHGRKSPISPTAPSALCFEWLIRVLNSANADKQLARVEIWHEGRCGRCGRRLTVPESIQSGIGPVCEGM